MIQEVLPVFAGRIFIFIDNSFRLIDLKNLSVQQFADGILKNDKVILSRAITLMESNAQPHREKAWQILELILPKALNSLRIGITGPPGAGKSTFIEAIGKLIGEAGKKLAVLAVDPTSKKNKGSILGDKTRMQSLSSLEHVFIRPTASGAFPGGVTMHTREVILLLECAGYDTILVETVGVGQGETAVHDVTDIFLLMMMAGAGDELQGIKRGIIEMADMIVINKNDGDNIPKVKIAKAEIQRALELFPLPDSGVRSKVESCSAITGDGVENIWNGITEFSRQSKANGYFEIKRREQLRSWMRELLENEMLLKFNENPKIKSLLAGAQKQINSGDMNFLFRIHEMIAGLTL